MNEMRGGLAMGKILELESQVLVYLIVLQRLPRIVVYREPN